MMTTVSLQIVGIIEPIIQHADWFFPGGEKDTQSVSLTLTLSHPHTHSHIPVYPLREIWTGFLPLFLDIEFNLTGSYGSPIHTNHNSNYSSMPSPDMDQSDRKQSHDQGRRPLSVATDNMMLEFYKKDG